MTATPSILQKIFDRKRERVGELIAASDVRELMEQAEHLARSRSSCRLSAELSKGDRTSVIAEFKRASPSRGVINDLASPSDKAREYESAGAAAISVLTEEDHFAGSVEDLKAVRSAVDLPILRKDFIFDPFQVYETAVIGADAVLLIAAMLGDGEIQNLKRTAESLGLDALVEVHSREELERALDTGAQLIGVNNRDLSTFEVSLDHSRELIRHKPDDVLMISESGISSFEEIEELRGLGFDGFLIGEALMRETFALGSGTSADQDTDH